MKKFFYKILFFIISFPFVLFFIYLIFNPIFNANHLIFPYAVHPFDIVSVYPNTWILLKKIYLFSFLFSYFILYNKIFNFIFSKIPLNTKNKINFKNFNNHNNQNSNLSLFVGLNDNLPIYIDEKGLYQNILITGTIGTGKTSSAMYPLTRSINRLHGK